MSGDSAEVAEDYRLALEDLSSNLRFEISNLTVIARENTEHALAIAEVLQQHILKAAPSKKLPALYVLDSIVKNVGTPYTLYFGRNLFKTFMESYAVVDQPVRRKMEEMLRTWKEPVPGSMDSRPVFSHELVRPIENALLKARAATMPQAGMMPGRPRSAVPHRDTPTPPGMRFPPGHPAQQYTSNGGQSLSNDIRNLIVTTQAEASRNPHDHGVQTRLRALHDLQVVVNSTSLPPDQLELIKNKVTELAAVNMMAPLTQRPAPTPPVPVQARPIPMPPVSVALPQPAAPAPAQEGVTLDALLGKGALAALMARQSATPQNSTPTPQPTPVQHEPPKPPMPTMSALEAMMSMPPMSATPTMPAASTPVPPPASAAPWSLLDQLRKSGLLPPAPAPAPAPVQQGGINLVALKQPCQPSLIRQLHNDLGQPCTQCGRRFRDDEAGKKKKIAHMDWHFRVHQRTNEAEKRGMHRSWYVDQGEWLKSREVVDVDHVPTAEDVAAQASKASEAAKPKYIPVPDPSRGINPVCPICQDRFENKWLDTAQEWTPQSNSQKRNASNFFSTPAPKRQAASETRAFTSKEALQPIVGRKRTFEEGPGDGFGANTNGTDGATNGDSVNRTSGWDKSTEQDGRVVKKTKTQRAAPLAERMRPRTLDEVCGQDLVGPTGVLRSLIESSQVPSMILWGASGTGKTTIARCIAHMVGSRFIELNATSTGVSECKKYFQEATNDLALTGRKTIIFCDEIHRFNKAQQDVFLKPVEAGTVTLIGATTENPSFKVASALLSRCRTFTLRSLATEDVVRILQRAIKEEESVYPSTPLLDEAMVTYLARFADGDARTALNLLELALSLTKREGITQEDIKAALTKTLVYDRAGDQHYDTISAFHKSVRGNDADAALYYLARMLQSGEDPLFIARRMVVIASEDVGLADNTLLPLATATYTATQQIGMPEARIPLAHCAVALCNAPKSTKAYRALNNAYAALREPGVAGLPVPLHLRNAPTRLMRDMGYGAEYKYPPNYREGRVKQTYLPDELLGRRFVEDRDLGTEVDPDLEMGGI
ncbi:ATPase WRNIP1 C26H5.02c [Fusarium culmorum]|uniref:ATPase WRNIP1 C26H5.02c n=1 Tax=Fusarium culmorum TaxID=5516 RepID=A0A2T4GXA6_FUSCU|nr:ATPase WRNIP1 C26H5.02c [Fusarium culmorum]